MVDNSSSQERATVEIFGDDRKLFGTSVILGKPVSFHPDVTSVLRLKIVITATTCVNDSISSYFALGDPQLLAVPAPGATG